MASPHGIVSVYMISQSTASGIITRAIQKLGYWAPKKAQLEIIHGFLNGRDVFGVLPYICQAQKIQLNKILQFDW